MQEYIPTNELVSAVIGLLHNSGSDDWDKTESAFETLVFDHFKQWAATLINDLLRKASSHPRKDSLAKAVSEGIVAIRKIKYTEMVAFLNLTDEMKQINEDRGLNHKVSIPTRQKMSKNFQKVWGDYRMQDEKTLGAVQKIHSAVSF